MNIGLLSHITLEHNLKGGMEVHGQLLIQGLVERGHKVRVITTEFGNGERHREVNDVQYYAIPGSRAGRYGGNFDSGSIQLFHQLHLEEPFDLIWGQEAGAEGYARLLSSRMRVPFVTVLHGTWKGQLLSALHHFAINENIADSTKYILSAMHHWLFWRAYIEEAAGVICVSDAIAQIASRYRVDPRRMHIIYNGVDVERFAPDSEKRHLIRQRYGVSEETRILLYAGKLVHEKGLHIAIHALPVILAQYPRTELWLVGKGLDENNLRRLAQRKGVAEHVKFIGFVPNAEIEHYYNACDLVCFPTLRVEGHPFLAIEAAACGKPVVASRIGGVPFAVQDNVTGRLVPQKNIKALAAAVIELLNKPALLQDMGFQARCWALEKFNSQKMVDETVSVFERCVASRNY